MNEHSKRINYESGTNKMKILYVPCFSLNTILTTINDVSKMDYFSLDVEGGEYDVLKSIDYKKTIIDSLSIEYNSFSEVKQKIVLLLEKNNFELIKTDKTDIYFKRRH